MTVTHTLRAAILRTLHVEPAGSSALHRRLGRHAPRIIDATVAALAADAAEWSINEAQAAEIERLTAERDELRRQLAEAEQDARRYRWIAGHCRSTSEHWGGRWSIVVEGPCPAKHDEEGAFDDAIDVAMGLTRTAEEA